MWVVLLQDVSGPTKLVGLYDSKDDARTRIVELFKIKIGSNIIDLTFFETSVTIDIQYKNKLFGQALYSNINTNEFILVGEI